MAEFLKFNLGQKFCAVSHLACGRAKFLPLLLGACLAAGAAEGGHDGSGLTVRGVSTAGFDQTAGGGQLAGFDQTARRVSTACDDQAANRKKDVVMKKIIAKHIDATKMPAELSDIPARLDAEGVAYNAIGCNNWPEAFPYTPKVEVRVAHTGDAIVLHYRVEESTVQAEAGDNGKVWEDSCCEFFSIPAGDGVYYNIECNCAGQMLIGGGAERKNRERAAKEVLDTVKRWSSLGREPFAEKAAPASWQMVMVIPASAFFKHHIGSFTGKTIRANFYKCGDRLKQQHYLSWNPIDLPRPNFHCPEFFGELTFE